MHDLTKYRENVQITLVINSLEYILGLVANIKERVYAAFVSLASRR